MWHSHSFHGSKHSSRGTGQHICLYSSFLASSSSSSSCHIKSCSLSVQLWVDRITQTWVHCSKFTGRSIRARNLEDSFVHSQQHLLQENAALRQSLEDLTKHQAEKQSHLDSTDKYVAQLIGAICVLGTSLHLSGWLDLAFSETWQVVYSTAADCRLWCWLAWDYHDRIKLAHITCNTTDA